MGGDMEYLKIQNQLSRINGAYQRCMNEMQAHGIDTNPLVALQVERYALVGLLVEEISNLSAQVDGLRKIEQADKKRPACHVS